MIFQALRVAVWILKHKFKTHKKKIANFCCNILLFFSLENSYKLYMRVYI
jgi:hypothetical protein